MKQFFDSSRKLALFVLCALLLASCSMPGSTRTGGGGQVWLDQPVTGSLLPLAAFTLKAHASPGTSDGVSRIEFLVNDVSVGSVDTDSSLPIVYAETSWNPSTPGSYTISARSYSGNNSSTSAIAMVCVSNSVTTASAGYSGDCANPIAGAGVTGTPGSAPFTIHAEVLYNPAFYGSCEPSTLKVQATLSGDVSSVDSVHVSYLYDTLAGTSPFGLGDVPYDSNVMTLQPDGTYLWSTNLNADATRWGLSGDTYMLYAYVEAFNSSGGGVGDQFGPISVRWQPCGTAAITPTFTPPPAVINPPSVTITSVTPSDTGYYITGCGPNTITVQAHADIAPGPSTVTLVYQYSNGTSGSLTMGALGGGDYQATLPLDMSTYNALLGVNGTVIFTATANDSHGNTGTSAASSPVTLMYCPG